MKKYSVAVFFSLLIFQVNAEQLVIYQLESDQTYIQAPLEHEIYFYSQDKELGDLLVQDAQGNNLPFQVITTENRSQGVLRETPVPFFPIAPNTSAEILHTLSSTRIQIKQDQVQVDIQPDIKSMDDRQLDDAKQPPEFYLLDLQAFQKNRDNNNLILKALTLDWERAQDQYQTWALSGSNDLRNWHFLRNTSLVRLEKEGYQLLQNRIELGLNPNQFAYLKLACIEFCSGLPITQIRLEEESKQLFIPSPMKWIIKGQPLSSNAIKLSETDTWHAAAIWEFTREDSAPVDQLGIEFGQQLYGDRLRLLGKYRQQDSWSLIHQGIWFNARIGTQWRASSPIVLQRQWRYFRLELASAIAPDYAPELVLQADPQLVQFIANQGSPYKLVIQSGSQNPKSDYSQKGVLQALLKDYSPTWSNHTWQFLNPPRPDLSMRISWQSFLLWGCMILAVILLMTLALKLFRQMNASINPQSESSHTKDGYKK